MVEDYIVDTFFIKDRQVVTICEMYHLTTVGTEVIFGSRNDKYAFVSGEPDVSLFVLTHGINGRTSKRIAILVSPTDADECAVVIGFVDSTLGIDECQSCFRFITTRHKCPYVVGVAVVEYELSGSIDDEARTISLVDIHTNLFVIGREDDDVMCDITGVHDPQVALSVIDCSVGAGVSLVIAGSRFQNRVGSSPTLDTYIVFELIYSRTV